MSALPPTTTSINTTTVALEQAATRYDNHHATYYENACLRTSDTLQVVSEDTGSSSDAYGKKRTDHELRQDLLAASFKTQDLNFYNWVQQHVERRWLYQQVHNHVVDALAKLDDTNEYENFKLRGGDGAAVAQDAQRAPFLGLVVVSHFTARESLNANSYCVRIHHQALRTSFLDVYRLTERERQHHQSGAVVYSFDPNSYAAYIQDLTHLQQGLRWRYGNRPYTSITVDQARVVAEQWVASLARLRMLTAGTVNTDPIPYYPIGLEHAYSGTGRWYFSHLLDQDSYTAEGAAMNHCVGSYTVKPTTRIYSLRHHLEKDGEKVLDKEHNIPLYTRIATLETVVNAVGRQSLVQVRMKNNAQPNDEVSEVVARWCEFNSVTDATKTLHVFGQAADDLVIRQNLLDGRINPGDLAASIYLSPNGILRDVSNSFVIGNAGADGINSVVASQASQAEAIERLEQHVERLRQQPQPKSYLTRIGEMTRRTLLGY